MQRGVGTAADTQEGKKSGDVKLESNEALDRRGNRSTSLVARCRQNRSRNCRRTRPHAQRNLWAIAAPLS